MSDDDKLLKAFIDKINQYQAEKRAIDEKIAALELSYELISGGLKPEATPVAKKGKAKRTNDREALEKTLAFLQGRKRPTTTTRIAEEFGIASGAASSRCQSLVALGWAKREGRGEYVAVHGPAKTKPGAVAEEVAATA